MRKQLFLFLFLIVSSLFTRGQNDYTQDTIKIRAQLNTISDLIFVDPDQAQFHIDTVLHLSMELQYKYGLYSAYKYTAIMYFLKNDNQASIDEYRKALEYADPKKPDQKIRLYSNISLSYRLLNNKDSSLKYLLIVNEESKKHHLLSTYQHSVLDLGTFYMDQEDYVTAVKYFSETEDNCKTSLDSVFLVKAYSSLARFYHGVNDFDKAYAAFQKAILIDKECKSIDFIAANYANLGESFLRLKDNYDTAIYFYRKSVDLSLPYKREKQKLFSLVNIGNAFLESERQDSAFKYYIQAYNNELINSYPKARAAVIINLGLFYNREGQYEKAYQFLTEGLDLAKDLKLIKFQVNALDELSRLEQHRKHYKASLEYHQSYHILSDSLKKIEAKHQLALVDYDKVLIKEKFNNELLIHENKNQQNQIATQRIIIILVIVLVLSLCILLFVFWRNKKITKALNENLQVSNEQLELANKELRQQKEEMKRLLMSKDRFVSMLGHDLKNPFSGLLGLLELILEDWDSMPDTEKKDGIYQLSLSAKQTYEFLQSLLDWGKAQQGLIKVKRESFYMKDVADEILVLFYAQYKKKNIHVEVHIAEDFKITSDRKIISQILQNFFSNALKYSQIGGVVQISTKVINKQVFICVTDEGIGIPEEKIKELLTLDSSFHRPGTEGEPSTGMGLILTKEYAQLLGGNIKVKSQINKGSEFCLVLD